MQNISADDNAQLELALHRPEGTFAFVYDSSSDFFDKEFSGAIIFQVVAGQFLFRVERDGSFFVHFYLSSPGTGTRVASIDLNLLAPARKVTFILGWSPDETVLHMQPDLAGAEMVSAAGVASTTRYRIGKDGEIYRIGDEEIDVMRIEIHENGRPILMPTAKEAWEETLHAIDVLAQGSSTDGYIFECVVTNLTLSVLVTGYEAYNKTRFLELETEGITPNAACIIDNFYPKKEKDAGIKELLAAEANELGISLLQHIVTRGVINFQSYDNSKRAFNKAYGIKYGNLNLPERTLEDLQAFIRYRHKIVHVSPCLGILNQDRAVDDAPVFPNAELASKARNCFVQFIEAFHQETLVCRPASLATAARGPAISQSGTL